MDCFTAFLAVLLQAAVFFNLIVMGARERSVVHTIKLCLLTGSAGALGNLFTVRQLLSHLCIQE